MNRLIEYGCDTAQGYYFSRAIPAADLSEWLASSPFGATRHPATSAAARAVEAVAPA